MYYSKEELASVVAKLSALIITNQQDVERDPTSDEIEKMLTLCKKRNRPSYYKLRHASGLSEAFTFKGISIYSDDGKKMRRFESGLRAKD